jgi:hypothetical protein
MLKLKEKSKMQEGKGARRQDGNFSLALCPLVICSLWILIDISQRIGALCASDLSNVG